MFVPKVYYYRLREDLCGFLPVSILERLGVTYTYVHMNNKKHISQHETVDELDVLYSNDDVQNVLLKNLRMYHST